MTAPLRVDCVGWLQNRLADLLAGPRVVTELPAGLAAAVKDKGGVVQLVPVGGSDDGVIVDSPRIAVHCFATTPASARELALAVGAALRDLVGAVAEGATMQSVVVGGLTRNDYPNTDVREVVRLIQPRIKVAG